VAEIADRAARQLNRDGTGKMYCLAGVGGHVPAIVERTKTAAKIVVIDGCDIDCGKHCLLGADIQSFEHIRVTDFGMAKGKSPVSEANITAIANRAAVALNQSDVVDAVRSKYAAVAESSLTNSHQGVRAVAEAFGYSAEELASIPAEANMGLSCGNPIATANLKPGETIVDLGSGGGLDVFLAAKKVGPTGKAIGIDMTQAMIDRANAAAKRDGYANVEFKLGTIDRIPLPDASADVVISNCVINLAPDKAAVFREVARILKPGGRLAISDIALKKPLPTELAQDIMAYVGCIAGAIMIEDYRQKLKAAGFEHVEVIDSGADLNAYAKVENQSGCCSPAMDTPVEKTSCCGSSPKAAKPAKSTCCGSETPPPETTTADVHARMIELLKRYNVNDYAASVKVFAIKPK